MGIVSKLDRKISLAASTIGDVECTEPEFLHSVLCQVSLPRNPTKERVFVRTSGAVSVQLKAGDYFNGIAWTPQPLPSGTRPRLVLIHACSEAVRTQSPNVEIGDSVSDFLRQLNVDTDGRTMKYFRREMMALSVCEMSIAWRSGDEIVQTKAPPIRRFNAWMVDDGQQRCMWPGQMKLDSEFFESLLEHAVPLDPRAISSLKTSSLALDAYTWLAHRLCRIRQSNGVMVSWANLHQQFGQEYASVKKFKERFLHSLGQAAAVYKAARIEQVRGGLRLKPSPPPIARKGVVVALPAFENLKSITGNQTPAMATTDTPDGQPPFVHGNIRVRSEPPPLPPKAAVLPQAPLISEDALAAVRSVAPGWDKYFLAARYTEWMKGREHPKNPDAAFLGWAKRFTKGKPPN